MELEGIHHITAISADGQANLDFYVGLLGLRLVKKTVNQDDPFVYHLFYGDREGSPGCDLTFFIYPHAARGRSGAGMVHLIEWRLASEEALSFWARRLAGAGVSVTRGEGHLDFLDPEGLSHRFLHSSAPDPPLRACSPEIPPEHALLGFEGVRAYATDPGQSHPFLVGALSFQGGAEQYEVRGRERGATYRYDLAPPAPGHYGAGTVHHVAFACRAEEQAAWRERVVAAGGHPTAVIDRHYFRSVYFHEPAGVLFELATIGPGFAVDEEVDRLGQTLALPPFLEPRRAAIEAHLPPLSPPHRTAAAPAA